MQGVPKVTSAFITAYFVPSIILTDMRPPDFDSFSLLYGTLTCLPGIGWATPHLHDDRSEALHVKPPPAP